MTRDWCSPPELFRSLESEMKFLRCRLDWRMLWWRFRALSASFFPPNDKTLFWNFSVLRLILKKNSCGLHELTFGDGAIRCYSTYHRCCHEGCWLRPGTVHAADRPPPQQWRSEPQHRVNCTPAHPSWCLVLYALSIIVLTYVNFASFRALENKSRKGCQEVFQGTLSLLGKDKRTTNSSICINFVSLSCNSQKVKEDKSVFLSSNPVFDELFSCFGLCFFGFEARSNRRFSN